jgi:hypothetical protein
MKKRSADVIIQLGLSRINCTLLIVIERRTLSFFFLFNPNVFASFNDRNEHVHSDTEYGLEAEVESRL